MYQNFTNEEFDEMLRIFGGIAAIANLFEEINQD